MKLKHLKTFNSFINESNLMNKLLILEALEPKVAKFYLEINTELRDKRLKEIWGKLKENAEFSGKNGDRIYFKSFELENEDLIRDYLENKGYQIEDYRNNKAYDSKNDRSNVKITKILTNLAQFDNYASELLKQYNDEASKGVEQRGKRVDNSKLIVFSKDTLDIAQMSTDRNWTSCTNVYDGGNRDYVPGLARAASALGVENFFIEVHPDPDNAPSDGPNMVKLSDFETIVSDITEYRYRK